MATEIQVRQSNWVDAGLTNQYFVDRGFTVNVTQINQQIRRITLNEDLDDATKNELQSDLMNDLSMIVTDVSDGGETQGTAKQRYKRVLDRCTRKRLRRGFEFPAASGDIYAMNIEDRAMYHRLWDQRSNLTYPYRIVQQDNTGGINISGQAQMNNFFDAFHDQMTLIEQEGVTGKADVQTAANKAAARAAAVTWLELPSHCSALVNQLGN